MDFSVFHDEQEHCFKIATSEGEARLDYLLSPSSVLDLYHTQVPSSLQGYGIGSLLVQHALHYARDHGYKVKPSCTFVQDYIKKHPQEHFP
jgi:predicted GNAT family acetyltransferase